MGGVHGVGPLARAVHCELAVAVVTCHIRLCHKRRRGRTVNVGGYQLSRCDLNRVCLAQCRRIGSGDERGIVRPLDRHGDGFGCAVLGIHRERIAQRLAHTQRLHCRVVVV